eukprot:5866685-Pyramimonas_sp.AAC.1
MMRREGVVTWQWPRPVVCVTCGSAQLRRVTHYPGNEGDDMRQGLQRRSVEVQGRNGAVRVMRMGI